MFTAEKFDPDEWAELFSKAGAKFAGPVGEHHDGFCMWDTQLLRVERCKDGTQAKCGRGTGDGRSASRTCASWSPCTTPRTGGTSPTGAESSTLPTRAIPVCTGSCTTRNGRTKALGEEAGKRLGITGGPAGQTQPRDFLDTWLGKTKEVIDDYHPDLLWFDYGIRWIQEHYKREMLAYYYNQAAERGQEVALTYKWNHLVPGAGLVDLELGRFDSLDLSRLDHRYHGRRRPRLELYPKAPGSSR